MQNKKNIGSKKIDKKAAIGTLLFYVALFVLLYFFGFRSLIPETEEGVLITFGTTISGGGAKSATPAKSTPTPQTAPAQNQPSPSAPPSKPVEVEEVIKTQDFDKEAPEIVAADKPKEKVEKPDPEIEKRKAEEEALRKKQKAEEDARLKQEQELELERKRVEDEKRKIEEEKLKKEEAERKRKQEIQDQLAELDQEQAAKSTNTSTSKNPFNNPQGTADAAGKGNTAFSGNQGSVNGDTNSNSTEGSGLGNSDNSFALEGRGLTGALPEPKYNVEEEGTVVVEITVDRNGTVVGATPILSGSNTQNTDLWRVAKEAALKARFSINQNAPEKQTGYITYHFSLD